MAAAAQVQVVEIADVLEEEEELSNLLEQHGNGQTAALFVLVSSEWCGDCIKGCPRVVPAISAESTNRKAPAVLIKLNAGERPVWRDPHHAYRESSLLRTKSIPTLYSISGGKVSAELVEGRLYEPEDDLSQFVATAFANAAKL